MGVAYEPVNISSSGDACPQCHRVGWRFFDACMGCGYIWPIVQTPIATPDDPAHTTAAPLDQMKATVDGWTDEIRKAAYKYLYHAYRLRIDQC